MSGRSRLQALAVVLLVAVVGAGVAVASGTDDPRAISQTEVEDDAAEAPDSNDAREDEAEGPDRPITGPDLERASQTALDYLGEGRVTATEIEDEESYYEIEVTRDDGSQVDVQLDEAFVVVGTD
jgi:uncharacterized membrane protein YkoI